MSLKCFMEDCEQPADPASSKGLCSTHMARFKPRFTPEQTADTRCGFCGKARDEVRVLIIGVEPSTAICDECTGWAWEIVSGQEIVTTDELLRSGPS